MDQPFSLQVFDFSHDGRVCEALVVVLKASFAEPFRWQIISEPASEFEEKFIENLALSPPLVALLVVTKVEFEHAGKFIQRVKAKNPGSEIMVLTEDCDTHEIFHLMKLGATDFIVPPINTATTVPRILRLHDRAKAQSDSTQSLKATFGMKLLVGKAPSFLEETKKIPLLASCDGRVLILGETGTGKELFARAIHYLSPRMRHPFVPVSCGAIPVDLLENELFGHIKGAFTGATAAKSGLIREAEGGTLFLDEVDALPLLAQTKLLRFLQEGEYRPLGASKALHADVRVIAASNADLMRAVKEGRLRQDLYYRLNIVRLNLPPLRERRDDIPLLASHFLKKFAHDFRRKVSGLSEAALRKLMGYGWPGNIRELENTIERAVVLTHKEYVDAAEIALPDADPGDEMQSFQESKARMITKFERSYIQDLMIAYRGNVTHAARAAKKHRRAFWELLRKYNIDVSRYKQNADTD